MNLPNFNDFDIENSELSHLEIVDDIICWRWKATLEKFVRLITGRPNTAFLEFEVNIKIVGVEKIGGSIFVLIRMKALNDFFGRFSCPIGCALLKDR